MLFAPRGQLDKYGYSVVLNHRTAPNEQNAVHFSQLLNVLLYILRTVWKFSSNKVVFSKTVCLNKVNNVEVTSGW